MSVIDTSFLHGKKILIAGGAGLLGVNLTRYLVDCGLDVLSTRFSRQPPLGLKNYYRHFDFENFSDCLTATEDCDIVIICAIQAYGVEGMAQSPTSSLLPNLKLQSGLLEACSRNKVGKTVWISSSTVYQEAFYPIREDQLDLNLPPYGLYQGIAWVYRYIEQLSRCYSEKMETPVSVIRTSSIYGPYDRFDDDRSHVIPAIIKRALKREDPFVVWGNQSTIRDFVYVDDLVNAVVKVLESYCNADPINFSNGTPVSISELVDIVLDTCDHKVIPHYDVTKPTAVPYRVLDNSKFDTILGGVQRTRLDEGIRKTVDWYTSSAARD
jgi:GDP-L-fucose synthase